LISRRAYIGAHVMAFEFAAKRATLRFEQAKTLGTLLVAKGEIIERDALDMAETATDTVKDKIADILPTTKTKTVEVKPTRVAKKAKPASKVRMTTIKTPRPTPSAKPSTAKTSKSAAQSGKILKDKYAPYEAAVLAYDADANLIHVKKIVDHLGVALNSRDGKFVACSDPAERETVAKSWLLKKLGVTGDMAALDAKVAAVCDTMKADRMKSRVTFYYLLAKNEGELGAL